MGKKIKKQTENKVEKTKLLKINSYTWIVVSEENKTEEYAENYRKKINAMNIENLERSAKNKNENKIKKD